MPGDKPRPHTNVIVASGYADGGMRTEMSRMGVSDILTNPFMKAELRAAARVR